MGVAINIGGVATCAPDVGTVNIWGSSYPLSNSGGWTGLKAPMGILGIKWGVPPPTPPPIGGVGKL